VANFTNFKLTEIMQVDTGSVLIFLAYRVYFTNIWQCANFDSIQFHRFLSW